MNLIVKLHGTSGAGKSTVAYEIMQMYPAYGTIERDDKVVGHSVSIDLKPLHILGRYTTQCGGCDTLKADQQIALLNDMAPQGHVFYEGLLSSEYYGRLGTASEQYGDRHVFAFLDTPIDLCIERVILRRLKAGNAKPLDETNTRARIKKIASLKAKLERMGRRVVTIPYQDATRAVLDLYRGADHG